MFDGLARDVLVLLGLVGLTLIFTRGFIFYPVRKRTEGNEKLNQLVTCPQCSGFWIGLGGLATYAYLLGELPTPLGLFILLLGAGVVSLISAAMDGGG